ncbi:hypothetical protein BJ165DRAFT_1067232 [Panaeolus papilionaceus]|nr:hypothetical protein BJ165DRAFT_1067232 [Panaeolus papilionaceus]
MLFRPRLKGMAAQLTDLSHDDIRAEESKFILRDTAYTLDRLIYIVETALASFRACRNAPISGLGTFGEPLEDDGLGTLQFGDDDTGVGGPLHFFPFRSSTYHEILADLGSILKIMQQDLHWHDSISDMFYRSTSTDGNMINGLERCRDQLGRMAGTLYQPSAPLGNTKKEMINKPVVMVEPSFMHAAALDQYFKLFLQRGNAEFKNVTPSPTQPENHGEAVAMGIPRIHPSWHEDAERTARFPGGGGAIDDIPIVTTKPSSSIKRSKQRRSDQRS